MANRFRHARRALLWLAIALWVQPGAAAAAPGSVKAPPPLDPSGDDLFLLQASTSPNVILVMDNSDSMNHIEWHPRFDPDQGSYGCNAGGLGCCEVNPGVTVPSIYDADAVETHCGNTRTIFGPVVGTKWDQRYLNWYFSDEADPYVGEIETAVANVAGCTQSGGAAAFAEKYRRTRLEASKQVLLDLLCVAESKNVRFGVGYYRNAADAAGVDPNGGYVAADLGRANPNHAAELESEIKLADTNTALAEATPLSETLFQFYTFWMSRDKTQLPNGLDGDPFPPYYYSKFGNWEGSNSNKWLEDALVFPCEKAFFVIVTDGLPTRDDFDADPSDTAQGFGDFVDLIGDYNTGDGETEVPGDADESTLYLDDIAKYMFDKDFRPDLAGDQTIDTYTVGLATSGATNDYLQKTADVGNGLFFQAKDGDELAFALIAALNDIIEKAASFTAAAVPSARTIDGGDFYQSYFFPSGKTAFWEGHIRAWHITATGDVLDANGQCALVDPTPGECNSGPFDAAAQYFWDTAEEMPPAGVANGAGTRTLYVSNFDASGDSERADFDLTLEAADLDIDPFLDDSIYPPDRSPNSFLYTLLQSDSRTAEGLADEVVAFARGCFWTTGVTDPTLTADPQACLDRPARLGDVFHSNPIVVKHPANSLLSLDPSYRAFRDAYEGRSRVIYAGTNAGFLEAFHAGDWQTPASGFPYYDAGTGKELFGFMPWSSRLQIKNLPIDSPTDRTHYVDGSPQVADVWLYPGDGTSTASKNVTGEEWRTMLVTGMRRGGRQYLALDITNPDGVAGPAGTLEYPGFQPGTGPAYGWEFPADGDPDGWLPHMGLTWSQPIITRVRVSVDDDGFPHERWVAIFTAGYDETGDPNPTEVNGRVSVYDPSLPAGRAIFVIDMKTGGVLARKKLDTGASDGQTEMLFAMPSTPAVFDLDGDGFADVVYVGNLGGTLFKWVIHPLGGDPINGTALTDDADQPKWPFKVFFQAPVEDVYGTLYFQNFFNPPAGALVNGKVYLAWGAAERLNLSYPGDGDGKDDIDLDQAPGTASDPADFDENNRFYVVSDPDPLERALVPLGPVTEADLVDATYSPSVSITNQRGFFIKGEDGEKFVTNTVIFAGKVVTASFKPTPSLDPCQMRGQATAYVFDLLTGEGYFTDASNNPKRDLDIGVGLPTDPKVSVGVGGKDNRVYIEKSGADLESFGAEDIPAGGRLLYWREVP